MGLWLVILKDNLPSIMEWIYHYYLFGQLFTEWGVVSVQQQQEMSARYAGMREAYFSSNKPPPIPPKQANEYNS